MCLFVYALDYFLFYVFLALICQKQTISKKCIKIMGRSDISSLWSHNVGPSMDPLGP